MDEILNTNYCEHGNYVRLLLQIEKKPLNYQLAKSHNEAY